MNLTQVRAGIYTFLMMLLLLPFFGCSAGDPIGMSSQDAGLGERIDENIEYIPGQVLLYFGENVPDETGLNSFLDENRLTLFETHEHFWGTFYTVEINDDTSVPDKCIELSALSDVDVAEPNYLLEFHGVKEAYWPNDPLWESAWDLDDDPGSSTREMWGPHLFGADLVWPDVTGEGVVIAVLDTGFNSHEDLDPNLWTNEDEIPGNNIDDDNNGFKDDIHGWDFEGNDANYHDPGFFGIYHGTSAASIAMARGGNGLGITGTAPHAQLMCIRTDLWGGGAYVSSVTNGIDYSHDNGADIMSMSFGSSNFSSIMNTACQAAYDDGIVLMASAGNDDSSAFNYPASYNSVMKIGACTSFGPELEPWESRRIGAPEFYWGSNYSTGVDVVAPGTWYIAAHGSGYNDYETGQNEDAYFGGTSCSCPFTAGVMALIMEAFPGLTPHQYRVRLREAADDMGDPDVDKYYGYGRINILRAIKGVDPNQDLEDIDGIIPIQADDVFHDNLNPNPNWGDFDDADYFKFTPTSDLIVPLNIEILNWGKDLILEVYDNPELLGDPVESSDIVNGAPPLNIETVSLPASAGTTYYIVVTPKTSTDCTTYRFYSEGDATSDALRITIEPSPLVDVLVGEPTAWIGTMTLEALPGLVYLEELTLSLQGTLAAEHIDGIALWQDGNLNGMFESNMDTKMFSAGSFDPVNRNSIDLTGLKVKADTPKNFFITLAIGLGAPEGDTIGVGVVTYKDVQVSIPNYVDHTSLPQLTDLKNVKKPGILFVDDDGEDDGEEYFLPHLDTIGEGYIIHEVDSGDDGPSLNQMQTYKMVLWTTGTDMEILSPTDRSNIGSYLSAGGRLMIVSRDLGWESDVNGYGNWLANVLHAQYVADDSDATLLDGVNGDPISDGIDNYSLLGGAPYAYWWMDIVNPVGGATAIFSYVDGYGGNAGHRYEEDDSRLVYLAFPIETMGQYDQRQTILERSIAWLMPE